MSTLGASVSKTGRLLYSPALQRQISSITVTACALLGGRRAGVLVTTAAPDAAPEGPQDTLPGPALGEGLAATAPSPREETRLNALQQPGAVTAFQRLKDRPADWLPRTAEGGRAGWTQFSCSFEDGSRDLIALRLTGGRHDAHCADILAAIWPLAREDCLRELTGQASSAVTSALLWTISQKTDSAVLVLNSAGQLLHCNESGRDILEAGSLLRGSGSGLRCANAAETKAFLHAVQDCAAAADTADSTREFIIFLKDKAHGMRLPVSLTRYRCASAGAAPLVVAILPRQPDRHRIEMLAQKMGLSPSEARVAALIQLGLSNREAAHIAGLKEQTFNTYAKRVLSKLDAAGRAEMAQRLTWQASLGRVS